MQAPSLAYKYQTRMQVTQIDKHYNKELYNSNQVKFCKYQARVEVTENNEHSSLLLYGIIYL